MAALWLYAALEKFWMLFPLSVYRHRKFDMLNTPENCCRYYLFIDCSVVVRNTNMQIKRMHLDLSYLYF